MRRTAGVRRRSLLTGLPGPAAHAFKDNPPSPAGFGGQALSGGDFLGHLADAGDADIPDETHRAEHPEQEPRGIELVPGKAVARGGGVRVMIVVPALAE